MKKYSLILLVPVFVILFSSNSQATLLSSTLDNVYIDQVNSVAYANTDDDDDKKDKKPVLI